LKSAGARLVAGRPSREVLAAGGTVYEAIQGMCGRPARLNHQSVGRLRRQDRTTECIRSDCSDAGKMAAGFFFLSFSTDDVGTRKPPRRTNIRQRWEAPRIADTISPVALHPDESFPLGSYEVLSTTCSERDWARMDGRGLTSSAPAVPKILFLTAPATENHRRCGPMERRGTRGLTRRKQLSFLSWTGARS